MSKMDLTPYKEGIEAAKEKGHEFVWVRTSTFEEIVSELGKLQFLKVKHQREISTLHTAIDRIKKKKMPIQ